MTQAESKTLLNALELAATKGHSDFVQLLLAAGEPTAALEMWLRATEIREEEHGADHPIPVAMRETAEALRQAAPKIEGSETKKE